MIRHARTALCTAAAALVAASFAPVLAGAQSAVGRVRENGTRRPLAGVVVALVDSAGHVAARTTTDSTGTFFLDAPAPGRYALSFAWAGTTMTTAPRALGKDEEVQSEYFLARSASATTAPAASGDTSGARDRLAVRIAKPATLLPNQPSPRYPAGARWAGWSANVLVQFLVDTTGRARMGTFKVLQSGGRDFDRAVHDFVPELRFAPAELTDGRAVAQIVELPVAFSSDGTAGIPCTASYPATRGYGCLR